MARRSNKSIAEILTPSATQVPASRNNDNDGLSLLERKINIATEGFTTNKFCELILRDRNRLSKENALTICECIIGISQLKRKEVSCYKPSDLWSQEDDLLFLKWVTNKRDRCYHTMSRDLSARPHEILNLKIKDIVFKTSGNFQYAEVLVNGKTGTRHIPLIQSIPYIKDWLSNHPSRNNPNSPLFIGLGRNSMGRQLNINGLNQIYRNYKEDFFPKLLEDKAVSSEEAL